MLNVNSIILHYCCSEVITYRSILVSQVVTFRRDWPKLVLMFCWTWYVVVTSLASVPGQIYQIYRTGDIKAKFGLGLRLL